MGSLNRDRWGSSGRRILGDKIMALEFKFLKSYEDLIINKGGRRFISPRVIKSQGSATCLRKEKWRLPIIIACTFPVARKIRNNYWHECQKAVDVGKWKGRGAWSSWRRPARQIGVVKQAWGANVSRKFLKPFRLRHVAYSGFDEAHLHRAARTLDEGLVEQSLLRNDRPTLLSRVINELFMSDQSTIGLLGTQSTRLRTTTSGKLDLL